VQYWDDCGGSLFGETKQEMTIVVRRRYGNTIIKNIEGKTRTKKQKEEGEEVGRHKEKMKKARLWKE